MKIIKIIMWRINFIIAKISGSLKRLGWMQVFKIILNKPIVKPVAFSLIMQDKETSIGLYKSDFFPDLWIPLQKNPGLDVDQYLFKYDLYHNTYIGDLISRGDTVIDCGGYIGLFTLWCLKKGAKRVIVFEPEKRNYECLRRNLSSYIDSGKVLLIGKGVWSTGGSMGLRLTESGVGHSLLSGVEAIDSTPIEVVEIDTVIQDLVPNERIGFIKMDVEGAEREALIGAKGAIARDKPKMFICSYHLPDDPQVITNIVMETQPDYRVDYTGFASNDRGFIQEQGVVFT
ncbi:FkbM family methyltransferase [Pelotomaculum isophthalicicum JI]|uniref:FkbM family methyltransferase n=1 Tax=Pelotomaculum isophthalicicum JI TaxID=947010 RepID=A0A9X4H7M8_9FIRM|nr:FkbM family methyltransferase [Pelotomaculum isophthalicicum]MDF9407834.1 FkbM family methyltransferase [Pelotomaculum isophthalicicum JI]